MLVPKRVKYRREFRGKMRGEAKGGKEVAFGEYGLQLLNLHGLLTVKSKLLVSR
jgi:large subunit ribosomal protein L16